MEKYTMFTYTLLSSDMEFSPLTDHELNIVCCWDVRFWRLKSIPARKSKIFYTIFFIMAVDP